MPSTNAPSIQPVLITFIEAAISNSKKYSATLKYQCTDAFFFDRRFNKCSRHSYPNPSGAFVHITKAI
jgi:hypothetical protein